ncbi:NADH-quinone oxidoreductase subunit J [Acidobacteriota bacterium]
MTVTTLDVLYALLFYGLAFFAVGSAIMVVTRKNTVHSAVFLVFVFFAVAALFVMLHAEFVAAVQILVYAGGIMVLFLFVIMLVNLEEIEKLRSRYRQWWAASLLALLLMVVILTAVFSRLRFPAALESGPLAAHGGNTEAVGRMLFTHFLLPFEIVSVLLLVAMIGAIVLARREY